MTQKHKIENGKRLMLEIAGETVQAGFNVLLDVPQLAYLPRTHRRPDLDTELTIDGQTYTIQKVRQSSLVPRMVVLELTEVSDG